MTDSFVPIDQWFSQQAACPCSVNGVHRCKDRSALGNLMSARPHGSDSQVILTSGTVPSGRVAHGKVRPSLPNLTGLRQWQGEDYPGSPCGPRAAIEKRDVTTPTDRASVSTERAIERVIPDVVRYAHIVGNIGNVE